MQHWNAGARLTTIRMTVQVLWIEAWEPKLPQYDLKMRVAFISLVDA